MRKNTITSSTAIIISHFCFPHTVSAVCLFSISWKASLLRIILLLTNSHLRLICQTFCASDDEWFIVAPVRLLPARHRISHQKQTKHKMCYQLYQELYDRVHTSCYFKRRTPTFWTEQIKLGPRGGTGVKNLQTAAFRLRSNC